MSKMKKPRTMNRRDFLRTSALSGAAVGAVLTLGPGISLASATKEGKWTLKYDCYIGATAETAQLDNWFLDEIEKRSNGRINIKKFWSGSLNKVGQHLPAIRDGLSEISMIAYGYYPSDVPLSRGLEWYYRGCDHADTLLHVCRDVYASSPELRQEWEERNNSKVLYFTNWSYCPFIMKKPISSIEDLRGKKIRGYGIATDTLGRLGAHGMPIVAGEVYTSLERGILDGAFGFAFITAEKMKLHEQAPYIVESGAGGHAPTTVVINRNVWNTFPDDLKEIVQSVVDELYDSQYLKLYSRLTEESVANMVKGGAKFSILPQAEIDKAKKLVQPAQTEKWIKEVAEPLNFDGVAFQKKIDGLIAKHSPGKLKTPWEVYQNNHG